MMRRIVLLTLTILLAGCATTRHEDLARLETRLDALEKRAASQADSALAGPGGPGSPEAVNARGEETLPTLFNRETEDSAWAAATVDRIRRTLTPELPAGGRLLDVSCRTTVCRVNLTFTEPGSREDLLQRFPELLDWAERGSVQRDSTSGLDVSVYLLGSPPPSPG